MKKYKVWKTFPVQSGTWHTEEFIIEADNFLIELSTHPYSNKRMCFYKESPPMSTNPYRNFVASFSEDYSVIEIKSE